MLAHAIRGVATLVGALPVSIALGLGRTLGLAAHGLLARPRGLARVHVRLAFPELTDAGAAALVRETFAHAGKAYAELALWRRRLSSDPTYVTIEGEEILADALAEGPGCLAITGHVGNWELLAARIAARHPLSVVARRVNDDRFDALVRHFRGDAGMEILLRNDERFLANVRDALGRGRIVALLIDQDSSGGGVFVPFFGRPAHTPPGAAILALRTKVPVVTVFIRRRPGGGHVIVFERVAIEPGGGSGRVVDLTARFTAAIEAAIRRAPAEWVWWHERWRRRPSDDESRDTPPATIAPT